MEVELSHWKGKDIKWELPSSYIPTQVEPKAAPPLVYIDLAKKKMHLQEILKATFNYPIAILKVRVILATHTAHSNTQGQGDSGLMRESCPVYFRVSSSIPGLHPLEISTPLTTVKELEGSGE